MNKIQIQTKDTYIPIELGEAELRFPLTDDAIPKLRKKMVAIQEDMSNISLVDEDDEGSIKILKASLKNAYDELFGEGSFDQIYEVSPSTMIVAEYLTDIIQGLTTELQKRGYSSGTEAKKAKYVKNQKKK